MELQLALVVSALAFAALTTAILRGKRDMFRNLQKGRTVFYGTAILSGGFLLLNSVLFLLSVSPGTHTLLSPATYTVVHYLGVIILAATGVVLLRSRIVSEKAVVPKRVLAIGAHPDDLEIACGGTLSKLHDAGHLIYGLVLTEGAEGGKREARKLEARGGGAFMGLDLVDVHNFTDTRLSNETNEIATVIEGAISRFSPDIILTHSANDQHQDHIAVHDATVRAARNSSTILCYESPSVTRLFSPTVFVDVSDYLDVKLESIRYHKDQRTKPYVQPEHVRGIAVFRGNQAKIKYAEGFEAVRLLSSAVADI